MAAIGRLSCLALLCCLVALSQQSATTSKNPIKDWVMKHYADFNCYDNCTLSATEWGGGPHYCTPQGTMNNAICTASTSSANCFSGSTVVPGLDVTKDWTVFHAGPCECPSYCNNRGSCTPNGCECLEGWTGEDCSIVDCKGQKCTRNGQCEYLDDLEISTCVCAESTMSFMDCSQEMFKPPPVPTLLGIEQYTDWDDYRDDHPIYNESTIAQIHLTIAEDDLRFLINPANQNIREYKHANFSFYNGATSMRMEDVGLRIKGGASRNYSKKSWRVSFSTFVDGRKWAQTKKISLKSVDMDALYVREKSSLAALYSMGAPAQRASHTMVYINEHLWGLYLILEEPGTNQFLKSRFGNDDGSLWKCQGDLVYKGDDEDDYSGRYKAANDNAEDYDPLINFIRVINETPDDEFEEQIQEVMNVEFFLRVLSAEVATGNWDGIYNGNNYFLYYNTDELFYYYRHDLDISFGSLDFYYHMSSRNVYEWASQAPPGNGQLLPNRILAVPSFQDIFSTYLGKIMTYVKPSIVGDYMQRVRALHSSINNAVEMDMMHSLDNAMYTVGDYKTNLDLPVVRPAFWVPNPFLNGTSWAPFLSFTEFLKIRNQATEQNLADGPPQL